MSIPFGSKNLGSATIRPNGQVIAGSFGTWTVRYVVGEFGMDDSGHLRITERQVGDWESPQFTNPTESGYATARTNSEASLELAWFETLNTRPFRKTLVVTVTGSGLSPGDWIEIIYGDTSKGGPGRRAQTFREPESEFQVLVDPFGANRFFPLEPPLCISVVGDNATELEITSPASAVVGKPHRVAIRMRDQWGNTDEKFDGIVKLSSNILVDGLPEAARIEPSDRGVIEIGGLIPRQSGDLVFTAICDAPATATDSNPVQCTDIPQEWNLYWGDFHGQSRESVGTMSARDYILFGRYDAAIDFIGHQANDFQITNAFWDELQSLIREFHEPGRFITFLGYEWSGVSSVGGDRNIHFLGDTGQLRRSSHALLDDLDDVDSDLSPVTKLHAALKGRDDVLLVPHVGGRHANLAYHDPELEPVVEIHSSHGTFEWLGREAVKRGYRVGFICGSDVHTGRPGACRPSVKMGEDALGVRGGLAAIYAADLSRESIFDALRSRRCYGTTGARIHIWIESHGQPMGANLTVDGDLRFSGKVRGTSPIQRVELLRSWEVVQSIHPRGSTEESRRLRITWSGAESRGRRRSTIWTGSLRIDGTVIEASEPVGFDHLGEGITQTSEDQVHWISRTDGDQDGVEIEIKNTDGVKLVFSSKPANFQVALNQIGPNGWKHKAGGEAREVNISWVNPTFDSTVLSFDFIVKATEAVAGAYFLRVLQKDCEMAWTSPYYVDSLTE